MILLDERLTHSVIGAFFDVYNALGFGFLEHVYASALAHELVARGHSLERELIVGVNYKGRVIAVQRLDMVVDGKLVIEIKSTRDLHKSAARQVHNYLRGTNLEVGLLLHFGPEPHFYRLIHENKKLDPPHPPNPPHRSSSS